MAAITPSTTQGPYGVLQNASAQADTGQTDWVNVPSWATFLDVYLNWTAKAGQVPLMDFALVAADPIARNDSYQVPLADWNGITQLTDTATSVIHVGPGITGIADDDTGAATGDSVYKVNTPLVPLLGFKTTLSRAAQAEIQTVTLTSLDAADSFTLTKDTLATVAFVVGTNCTAAAIQAAARTAWSDASLTVTGTTDAGPFTITFGTTVDETAVTVTDKTGCDGSVAETAKGGSQQTYTYTLAYHFH